MEEPQGGHERRWMRAAGLLLVTFLLAVVQPIVLVAVPLTLLAVTSRERRGMALVVALLAGLLAMGGPAVGVWYLERGWALLVGGLFVVWSLGWPQSRFLTRGLGSVASAFAGVALLLWVTPNAWAVADWSITNRLSQGAASALEAFGVLRGGGSGVSSALATAVYETAEIQGKVFPALLGLASVAGLGAAWWLYRRLLYGSDRGLGPLKDFRFNDQLIWILITGCLLLALSDGEGWRRTGANAVVFMGALYALRGAAVVVFLSGGVSFIGGLLAVLGLILLPPLVLVGALIIGLGDTWLDIRARARTLAA